VDERRRFDISSELFSFAAEEPLLFWKNLHVKMTELKKKKRFIKKKKTLTTPSKCLAWLQNCWQGRFQLVGMLNRSFAYALFSAAEARGKAPVAVSCTPPPDAQAHSPPRPGRV
jgi:hypothetical protein